VKFVAGRCGWRTSTDLPLAACRLVDENWKVENQPQHFNLAVLMPNWNFSIPRFDEARLRQEFFACAKGVDKAWVSNPERIGRGYYHADF